MASRSRGARGIRLSRGTVSTTLVLAACGGNSPLLPLDLDASAPSDGGSPLDATPSAEAETWVVAATLRHGAASSALPTIPSDADRARG